MYLSQNPFYKLMSLLCFQSEIKVNLQNYWRICRHGGKMQITPQRRHREESSLPEIYYSTWKCISWFTVPVGYWRTAGNRQKFWAQITAPWKCVTNDCVCMCVHPVWGGMGAYFKCLPNTDLNTPHFLPIIRALIWAWINTEGSIWEDATLVVSCSTNSQWALPKPSVQQSVSLGMNRNPQQGTKSCRQRYHLLTLLYARHSSPTPRANGYLPPY